jgi:hypothetical protein
MVTFQQCATCELLISSSTCHNLPALTSVAAVEHFKFLELVAYLKEYGVDPRPLDDAPNLAAIDAWKVLLKQKLALHWQVQVM